MMSLRRELSSKRSSVILYLMTFIVLLSFYLKFRPHMAKVLRTSSGRVADDFKIALMKQQNPLFLAATRINHERATGSAVCVVDPAITDCQNMGFAAFLLYTLDHILQCRAFGIHQPTVFWRACNSVCSRDPRVNSWDWYFEPVNRGLESEVENVFCPLTLDDSPTIIDNSFTNRSDIEIYKDGKIITTQERLRVNRLLHKYVKPNSRIQEKVEMFYQQLLVGVTVLGVHVRRTDHWKETSEKRLPSLMSWVKKAQSILETLPRPRNIFIASDNNEVIKKFVNYFGTEIVNLFQLLACNIRFLKYAKVTVKLILN